MASSSLRPMRIALFIVLIVVGGGYLYSAYGRDGQGLPVAGLFGKKDKAPEQSADKASAETPETPAPTNPEPSEEVAGWPNFVPIIERVNPAVVSITTSQTVERRFPQPFEGVPFFGDQDEFFRRFFGQPDQDGDEPRAPQGPQRSRPRTQKFKQYGLGSGVLVDTAGYVLTNNHVIQGADEIKVSVGEDSETKEFDAKVVGSDELTDVALLKIESAEKFVTAPLGDSDALKRGQWVLAIGNPFGLGHSVSAGIVSATGRRFERGPQARRSSPYDNFIQTDASINQGNSGGPLINLRGEVVGINTMIVSPSGGSVGIGFAIPINSVKDMLPQLREKGKVARGYLGVRIQPIDPDLATSYGLDDAKGALVVGIETGGPAEKAGIKQQDIILAVGGDVIEDQNHLVQRVARVPVGSQVKVTVWRDGKEIIIPVTVAERPSEEQLTGEPPPSGETPKDSASLDVATLGMTVEAVPREMQQDPVLKSGQGVVVSDVDPAGQAASKGIRPGDVILDVNGTPIAGVPSFKTVLPAFDKGKVVRLHIYREGGHFFHAFSIK